MEAQLVAQQAEYKGPVGLEDGGTVEFHCDTCGKHLIDFSITRPGFVMSNGVVFEGDYKASCPYCGNFSKTQHVCGGFHLVFVAKTLPNGHEQVILISDGQKEVDGVTIINIKKLEAYNYNKEEK